MPDIVPERTFPRFRVSPEAGDSSSQVLELLSHATAASSLRNWSSVTMLRTAVARSARAGQGTARTSAGQWQFRVRWDGIEWSEWQTL